jgi:hypothetical protein
MAATFTGTVNNDWNNGGNWTGGTGAGGIPAGGAAGDDCTVPKNKTVTLNDTACVCKSLVLSNGTTGADVGGILTASQTASSKLVVYNGITANGSSGGATFGAFSSYVNLDVSAVPTLTCEIYTNGAAGSAAATLVALLQGKINIKGALRNRWTLTKAALTANSTKSVDVLDATGWRVGDKLVFATTQAYNATPKTDLVTIATITPTTGTEATITWTDGTGTTGSVLNGHDTSCLVGNFHSNIIIGPSAANNTFCMRVEAGAINTSAEIRDVEFRNCSSPGSFSSPTFNYGGVVTFVEAMTGVSLNNNAFYEWTGVAHATYSPNGDVPKSDNQYYTTKASSGLSSITTQNGSVGNETNMCVYQATANGAIVVNAAAFKLINPMISGITNAAISLANAYGDARVIGGGIWSCQAIDYRSSGANPVLAFEETYLGKGFSGAVYANANNANITRVNGPGNATYTSCLENLTGGARISTTGGAATSEVSFFNKNGVASAQEIYRTKYSTTAPIFIRDNAVFTNANASLRIDTLGAAVAFDRSFPVLVKAGEAATIFVYARKNAAFNDGTNTRPTATLSGLGIIPITATMTDIDDTWYKLDLSYASGAAPSADGLLTLTLSCQSSTATAKAYFSGVPIAPFATRCRHYGYLYDETSVTRTVNPTIDVAEGVAAAYSGISVAWGASLSPVTLSADQTFQKLYDYTQAIAQLFVASALPLTGAGVAGSPALFAAANLTTTGYTLNGSGSISMGGKTLTASLPWVYTYTGGTFSQAASTPTFAGGTLTIGAAGTYTFVQASSMTVVVTPTAPSTYVFASGSFTGTLTVNNAAAHAITIEVPSGTTTSSTGNTGGAITFSAPTVTADISIADMPTAATANTRLQIINATAVSASVWAANTVYATGAIVKRTTGLGSEQTAGLYFRATTGGTSHATTEPTWGTTVGNTTTDGTVTWTTYTVLFYDTDPVTSSLTDTYIDGEEFLSGETITVRFAEQATSVSFKTYSTNLIATADGFSALVDETADDVYATYALDGSTYDTTYSPNYTSDYMVLDTNTDFAGASAYSYFCYLLTTSQGMYEFWGGMTGIDSGNIRINSSTLNMYFDESAGFCKQTDNVRIFRADGTRPARDPTTGGSGIEINWRTPVNVVSTGGSALTPTESAYLLALPSAASTASATLSAAATTPIAANMKQTNDTDLQGDGTESDKFRSVLVP